ncbi:MAG: hypothetical protein IKZ56_04440 [Bacteroidales bacterium]|nr:hypothetical protein [Bacteroidales bacterium]
MDNALVFANMRLRQPCGRILAQSRFFYGIAPRNLFCKGAMASPKNSIFAIMKVSMMTFNKMIIPVKKPYTCCKKSLQRLFCLMFR